jgi:voltage-gated potassium channel
MEEPRKPQEREDDLVEEELERERYEFLRHVEEILELPVLILGFVWLLLLIIELIWGFTPLLEAVFYFIWGTFILDFLLRLWLAPKKTAFLRDNWLTLISLMIPALRVVQIFRVIRVLRLARTVRSLNLVRVIGTWNRGMRALRNSMGRKGFGYVVILTILVVLLGSAGMFYFEGGNAGFERFGDALWWTAMVILTMGSGEWPVTPEGRILGFLLALYSFAVFGYVTATLASVFIGLEAGAEESELAGAKKLDALREEIRLLRVELQQTGSQPRREQDAGSEEAGPAGL